MSLDEFRIRIAQLYLDEQITQAAFFEIMNQLDFMEGI